jgi:hypothetical protein
MLIPYQLVSLWDLMQRLDAGQLIRAVCYLSNFGQMAQLPRPIFRIPPLNHRWMCEQAELIQREATRLELRATIGTISDIAEVLATATPVTDPQGEWMQIDGMGSIRLGALCKQLCGRIADELAGEMVLSIPMPKVRFYQPSSPQFGQDVENKFASAAFEIDEASKCFALNRYTACVFHLMRIMEIGIEAARKSLGIPDPIKPAQRNWGAVLKRFKDELEARNAVNPKRWAQHEDADFFADTYVSLDAVRNVWRNATMHVEKTYTEEEAEHIFGAVRGFMRKLASRVDEQGQPLA